MIGLNHADDFRMEGEEMSGKEEEPFFLKNLERLKFGPTRIA